MREILCRAKDVDYKEWVCGYICEYPFGKWPCKPAIIPVKNIVEGEHKFIQVDPDTVSQYTGEKELSSDGEGNTTIGERIFDQDIIEVVSEEDGNGIYLVFWNNEKGGWDWKHISGAKPSEDYIDAIRIIGNKWDNPELLGAKE